MTHNEEKNYSIDTDAEKGMDDRIHLKRTLHTY